MLETLDLTRALDRNAYVDEVTARQIQLRELGYQIYLRKRGPEATGKITFKSPFSRRRST